MISKRDVDTFFGKVFRALFFYHTATVFHGVIECASTHIGPSARRGQEFRKYFESIQQCLMEIDTPQPEIFRYRIATLQEPKGNGFALWLTFYDVVEVFGIGTAE